MYRNWFMFTHVSSNLLNFPFKSCKVTIAIANNHDYSCDIYTTSKQFN